MKSCRMTRAGLKGTSTVWVWVCFQLSIRSTSSFFTRNSSQFLTADSSSTRMEKGRCSVFKKNKFVVSSSISVFAGILSLICTSTREVMFVCVSVSSIVQSQFAWKKTKEQPIKFWKRSDSLDKFNKLVFL